MCKFFARNHRLAIVSGRWLGQPRNERLCQHCQELEDEYHFVLICKKDNLIRYIKSYYFVNPSMFKLTQLLTSENRKTIHNLATYVYKEINLYLTYSYISGMVYITSQPSAADLLTYIISQARCT